MKLVKKYLNSGILHHEMYLQKDPIPEQSLQLENMYLGPTDYSSAYGSTPLIDLSLPPDHPYNVRNAIAQQQGWIEVPADKIDVVVNQKWVPLIQEAIKKYGPKTKYIVNPQTREIVPESVFLQIKQQIGEQNTYGAIDEARTAFEVQQAKNHRELKNKDPQDIAKAVIVTGAATNPATWPLVNAYLSADYIKSGVDRAITEWNRGNRTGAVLGAAGDVMIGLSPFSKYTKVAKVAKYAPRVGLSLLGAGAATTAYAGESENTEPHDFISTVTPEQRAMIDNPNTNWAQIGNDIKARELWNAILEKELEAAHFTHKNGIDKFLLPAIVIEGNKGLNVIVNPEDEGFNPYGWPYWVVTGLRYSPLIGKGLSKAVDGTRLAKALGAAWNALKTNKGWIWYTGLNMAGDTAYNIWARNYNPNEPTEANPDGYDEGLAAYYLKLVNAYLQLNSSAKNGYAVGSSFSPYQTHPFDANGNPANNFDWRVGKSFDRPDTNAIVIIQGQQTNQNQNLNNSEDSLTNAVGAIPRREGMYEGR